MLVAWGLWDYLADQSLSPVNPLHAHNIQTRPKLGGVGN